MTALHGWGLPEQHLAMDALVAFVDGELTPCAYDRAAAHIARCSTCSAEATVQRNARTAVRSADTPAMSSRLLDALHSIPSDAELPGQPDGLAFSEDGQLVTVNRQDRSTRLGTGPVLGSSAPLGSSPPLGSAATGGDTAPDHPTQDRNPGRRTRQGASVVFSGLVLGALALINLPADDERTPTTFAPRTPQPGGTYSNGTVPASSHTPAQPRPPQTSWSPRVAAHTTVLPESPTTTAPRP